MLLGKEANQFKKQFNRIDNKTVKIFNALGDTNRFKIFTVLMRAKKDICVSDFADICDISIPAASQQLRNLELSGLITKIRSGQSTCYKINYHDPAIKSLTKMISTLN